MVRARPRLTSYKLALRQTLASLCALVCLLWISSAAAQNAYAQAQAKQAFIAGRALVAAGDRDRGCRKLRESLALAVRPGTLLNVAQCAEQQGQLVEASEKWQAARTMLPAGDPRRSLANARITALDGRIPRLTLRLLAPSPTAQITLDGTAVAHNQAIKIDPGMHRIMIVLQGHAPTEHMVSLLEREAKTGKVATMWLPLDRVERNPYLPAAMWQTPPNPTTPKTTPHGQIRSSAKKSRCILAH